MRLPRIKPDFYIGGKENPYLLRWYITPWSGWFRKDQNTRIGKMLQAIIRALPNIYLHKFLRDDDDRALHDHPWVSISIILRGHYIEHTLLRAYGRHAGQIIFRHAWQAHRIELLRGRWCCPCQCYHYVSGGDPIPAWTLFITGPKIREWGFHCPKGWVHWKEFVAETDTGNIGKGCP